MRVMQHQYALAEGAEFRSVRWNETNGDHKEFPSSMDLFRFASENGWEFVTVVPSGKTGTYRQYFFKRAVEN
jgi:hypothetical protein